MATYLNMKRLCFDENDNIYEGCVQIIDEGVEYHGKGMVMDGDGLLVMNGTFVNGVFTGGNLVVDVNEKGRYIFDGEL